MEAKDRFVAAELLVTAGMVLCAVWLFPQSVIAFRPETTIVIVLGLVFSVFRMTRTNGWQHIAAPAAIAAICGWMIYVIFSASLAYRELVVTALQGLILIEIALSFTLFDQAIMGYVQALSIPLFMAHALFVSDRPFISFILIGSYLILAGLAMRFKLAAPFSSGRQSVFTHVISFVVPAAIIIASMPVAGILFETVPLPKIQQSGSLFGASDDMQEAEKDYYEKQEQLRKESIDLIMDLSSNDRRIEAFDDLNNLVKESSLTIDADQGEEGLISLLKTPGAGLDPVELEKRKHLTAYSDAKTKYEQKKAVDRLSQLLRNDPFNLPVRISIMNHANRIRQARSLAELSALPDPDSKIKDQSLGSSVRSEISELIQRLQEWRLYEIYRADMAYLAEKAQSMDGERGISLGEMVRGLQGAGVLADIATMQAKIEASSAAGDFSGTDIPNRLQEALDIKTHMIQVGQAARAKAAVIANLDLTFAQQDEMLKRIDQAVKVRHESDASSAQHFKKSPISFIPYQPDAKTPLISLTVMPVQVAVGIGDESIRPSVIGTCADGSSWDCTDLVFWKSADPSIADVVAGRLYARAYGQVSLHAVYESTVSEPLYVTVEKPKLASIIVKTDRDRGDPGDIFTLTASGVLSDGNREDLTGKATWVLSDQRVLRFEKNRAYPQRLGTVTVHAQYEGITSQPVRIAVFASARWILGLLARGILIAVMLVLAIVTVLLLMLEEKKKAISLKKSEPGKYIMALYENVREAFSCAGMGCRRNLSYKEFVAAAQLRFKFPDRLLEKMTQAYEEAKFSSHAISESDMLVVAADHNKMLDTMIAQMPVGAKIRLLCLMLVRRVPFSV